jgi:hypothetical protein
MNNQRDGDGQVCQPPDLIQMAPAQPNCNPSSPGQPGESLDFWSMVENDLVERVLLVCRNPTVTDSASFTLPVRRPNSEICDAG